MAVLDVASEYLSATEASVVADVAVRDVNRVMDEHIIPDEFYTLGERRGVRASACSLIYFYFHCASDLTPKLRESVIAHVSKREELDETFEYLFRSYTKDATKLLEKVTFEINTSIWSTIEKAWEIEEDYLNIKFSLFLDATTKRFVALKEAKHLVVEDPEILSGTPVIRGTRVPVYDVAASVRKGIPTERIKAAYPSLDERAIELAKIYADATPLRGRPKEPEAGSSSMVIRRIPRRAKK